MSNYQLVNYNNIYINTSTVEVKRDGRIGSLKDTIVKAALLFEGATLYNYDKYFKDIVSVQSYNYFVCKFTK